MKQSKEIKKRIKNRYKYLIEQVGKRIIAIERTECQGIDFDILRPYYNKVVNSKEKVIFWRF